MMGLERLGFYLFLHLLERVGFLIATAFVFSQNKWMRGYMDYQRGPLSHWGFIALFSFFAILGTHTGITVSEFNYDAEAWAGEVSKTGAISNSRTVGVVIAGLLGGVIPGIVVGIISGIHRYSLAGFLYIACLFAPIAQGILAGLMKNAFQKRYRHISSVQLAFAVGFLAEALQMGMILLIAKPYEDALGLVSLIAAPQILANSIGVALFFYLYMYIKKEEERAGADLAIKALRIADLTLPQWTKPLSEAAQGVSHILIEETRAIGATFHRDEQIMVAEGKETEFSVDVPMRTENKKIGTFTLFYETRADMNAAKSVARFGLTQLFSQQYAFVETERQSHLLADAEIRALQAQMNPHFLFNVLNTVKSFIRTKPEDARQMITQLAKYLRQNMQNNNRPLITVQEELSHVESYLSLIRARMGDKLEFIHDIDEELLHHLLPPFSIQPLVENSIEYGLKSIRYQGRIVLRVKKTDDRVWVSVEDNGVWKERSSEPRHLHMGFALSNIEQRLKFHFGAENELKIEVDKGTTVSFWLR
jgi:two-component system sensor histidine kinase LytS